MIPERCALSFLVDDLPIHYYQAELLLYSLQRFTTFRKENIIVHCTDRVGEEFVDFLRDEGYEYKRVEPYLDGKYCNKLTQLEYFYERGEDLDGVFLVDTDTFFLDDPFVSDKEKFAAKIVDGPNPPLPVIERIYKEAGIALPKIVHSDWLTQNDVTVATNFNGGFYYIPIKALKRIGDLWKNRAEWLYAHRELFDTPAQAIHVDQIAMSMAVVLSGVPVERVGVNQNYPIHIERPIRSLDRKRGISMLHYHREIDRFGLLNERKVSEPIVIEAIRKANKAVASMPRSRFYAKFRQSLVRIERPTDRLNDLEERVKELAASFPPNTRLILHGGTPKTGTTTLQFFWDEHREEMLEEGILYGEKDGVSYAPKHQWMVSSLKARDYEGFLKRFDGAARRRKDAEIHTVILSTEGIYNHWWDYSAEAKNFLRILGKYFAMEIWIWLREPISFAESLYRQYLKNPRIKEVDCYGRDLSLDDMMRDEWFVNHLDYLGFLEECHELFGERGIKVFEMQKDVLETMCEELNLNVERETVHRHNEKLDCTLIDVLRIFNRHEMPIKEKSKLVDILYGIEEQFGKYFSDRKLCNGNPHKIEIAVARQLDVLEREYKIRF